MVLLAMIGTLLPAAAARGEFPYKPQGAPGDYAQYRLPAGAGKTPDDLGGDLEWMYASTASPDSPYVLDERELRGVRGAHLADAADVDQGWRTTTGRPDVTIAVLDSGIQWEDTSVMSDVRFKTRINPREVPTPEKTRTTATVDGVSCATFTGTGDDLDGNGVFNLRDFACDARVAKNPARGVNPGILDPQDVLIAFSDGTDADGNGYKDDIVGWDFLDDDNDPFDDVAYGHGSGEARDSAAEADNSHVLGDKTGEKLGTCPNCMEIHLRVGTSFVADVNRFALATAYAVDNDVEVVQEALGTLNKSTIARQAVDYAWNHGVTVIASAADEAAQHNNWPSSYPHVILVNSVTHTGELDQAGPFAQSYLQFNGCTNFNAKIDLAIPSVSCSSDATGRAAGMAGLVHSAALNAVEAGKLERHPSCRRVGGGACTLSAAEVKQLMASGTIGGEPQADDVNFAQTPNGISTELPCPAPGCTDPFLSAPTTRNGPPETVPRSYPARKGHDQFYGYGRVNMDRVLKATAAGTAPPEVEITAPAWYDLADPTKAALPVRGRVWARGAPYTCQVLVAPGAYPAPGDFKAEPVASSVCDGKTKRSLPLDGVAGTIDVEALKALFPPGQPGQFDGTEHGELPEQPYSGRPNTQRYGFVVKIVADVAGKELRGEDRRQLDLHRDQDLLPGFPKKLSGDIEASPTLADLDGDNRNELVLANSDGLVHAYKRDGSELAGFPAAGDPLPDHRKAPAFDTGAVDPGRGAFLGTPAVGDLDHDGALEIVASDLEGRVYVFDGRGQRVRRMQTNRLYAGQPARPFENVRHGELNRVQLGFIASPVLADLDGDDGGRLEIVGAAMDRHVYAWNDDGSVVPGYPVLVVDRAKAKAIDPETHRVDFKDPGGSFLQGAIVDTPAVGDLTGDGRPEIVVGTNETYKEPLNAGGFDQAAYGVLGAALTPGNSRLFAIKPGGEPGGPKLGSAPWLDGWPFKVGVLQGDLLPLVGEGITGNPVIGELPCRDDQASTVRVGTIPAAGLPYLVDPDGQSCLGRVNGLDEPLPTAGAAGEDQPFLAAVGHPAIGPLADGPGFFAPAAGVLRAADVVLPEYQGGQDYLAAWSARTGRQEATWPRPVNDLQFLTGPSIADIDPSSEGEEILDATAHNDLQAFTPAGTDVAGWPKLTGDWSVAVPTIGTWGTLDTDPAARRVVVHGTRGGQMLVYGTEAGACAAASWPHFHHDNANSGDARRDATVPGRPTAVAGAGPRTLGFVSPGDDGLCGKAARYEVVTSAQRITPASFAAATKVPGDFPAVDPGAGAKLAVGTVTLERYVAVRAVDEQGNVGLPGVLDRGEGATQLPPGDGDGDGDGGGLGGGAGGGGGGAGPGGPGPVGGGGGGGTPPGTGTTLGTTPAPGGDSGDERRRCLPSKGRFTRRGLRGGRLGAFRLGRPLRRVIRAAGRPTRTRRGGVRRWCVKGGGHVTVLTRKRRVALVATTARGHRAGALRRGRGRGTALRGATRLRRGIYRRHGVAFGLRNGRVRYLAVTSKRLRRTAKQLRRALVRAKL
jgi:hypothetical protein